MPTYQPFQQRVIDERESLVEKATRLDSFIGSLKFQELPPQERDRLRLQLVFMGGYQEILRQRIDAFDLPGFSPDFDVQALQELRKASP